MDVQTEVSVFCENIRQIRRRFMLSTKSMAMLLDIEEEDVLALESGRLTDNVTVEMLFRTIDVFSIPVDELFSMPPVCEGPAVSTGNDGQADGLVPADSGSLFMQKQEKQPMLLLL